MNDLCGALGTKGMMMSNSTGAEEALNTPNTEDTIDPENYFALRAWLWTPEEEDYTTVIQGNPALKEYSDYHEAEHDFFALSGANFPNEKGKDLRMELTHFRFGDPHLVRTQIIFP
jgi:hypothetical protein